MGFQKSLTELGCRGGVRLLCHLSVLTCQWALWMSSTKEGMLRQRPIEIDVGRGVGLLGFQRLHEAFGLGVVEWRHSALTFESPGFLQRWCFNLTRNGFKLTHGTAFIDVGVSP